MAATIGLDQISKVFFSGGGGSAFDVLNCTQLTFELASGDRYFPKLFDSSLAPLENLVVLLLSSELDRVDNPDHLAARLKVKFLKDKIR